jgi:HEAT repeat protein
MKISRRWRRLVIAAAVLGAIVGSTWLVLREMAYMGRLPPAVRERMPAHWRTPWGLSAELRDGIEGMYSPDGGERALAAHRAGNLGPDAAPAIPYLMALLADEVPFEPFGKTPPPSPTLTQRIRAWIDSLAPPPRSKDYEAWWKLTDSGDTAAEALGDIGPASVEPLLAALADPLPRVRGRAALALSLTGDERATDALAALANSDSSKNVRWTAVAALGRCGDPRAVPALIDWMKNHPHDTYWAADALARTGDERAVTAMRDMLPGFYDNPCYLEIALLRLGPRGMDVLMKFEGKRRADMAADLLWQLQEYSVPTVDPRLFDLMAESLVNYPPRDINAQVGFLVQLDPKRATEPLLAVLKKGNFSDEGRSAVFYALGQTGDERALTALLAALPETKGYVRLPLIAAIGKFRTEAARQTLMAIIEKGDDEADDVAWQALNERRDPRILPIFAARQGKNLSSGAIRVVGKLGPAAIPALLEKLADPDSGIRQNAIWALADIGDGRAFEALAALYTKDPAQEVRTAAGYGLAKLRADRAQKFLVDEFNNASLEGKNMLLGYMGESKDPATLDVLLGWWQAEADRVVGHKFDPLKDRLDTSNPAQAFVFGSAYTVSAALLQAGDVRGIGPWIAMTRLKGPRITHRLSMEDFQHPIDAWGKDFADLAELGPKAVGLIEQALAVDNPEVQTDAAAALLVIGDSGGDKAVWAAWPGLHFEVRRSVAAQLGRRNLKDQVEPKRAREILAEIIRRDPDRIVRREAFRQLAKLADKATRAAYDDLVAKEPRASVREYARLTLIHAVTQIERPTHYPLPLQYMPYIEWKDEGNN